MSAAQPASIEELSVFLVRAKLATHAALGDVCTPCPLLPGTHQFEYAEGEFLYRDVFAGCAYFVGQELVYERHHPAWSMCYAGGAIPGSTHHMQVDDIYAFLRHALRQLLPEAPFRGPPLVVRGALRYRNEFSGDLARFHGNETIVCRDHPVFESHYAGGMLLR